MQRKIDDEGVSVSDSLEDLLKIIAGQNLEATPHMKFFWQEQMKLLQAKKMGRRYHPQIIRFALSLHGKSPSAYRELRDSGALILPSERVLRDYKNYFKPKAGINSENIEDLRGKTANFNDMQRYVVVVMDEMKIPSNLVFDKYSGDLIGFIDLGDPMTNFANLQEEGTLASHALAFLVRGMCTDLKHVIAYFFSDIHIFVFTDCKNNRFQKKLIGQNTNMNICPPPPPPIIDIQAPLQECHIIPVNAHFLESGVYFGDITEAVGVRCSK